MSAFNLGARRVSNLHAAQRYTESNYRVDADGNRMGALVPRRQSTLYVPNRDSEQRPSGRRQSTLYLPNGDAEQKAPGPLGVSGRRRSMLPTFGGVRKSLDPHPDSRLTVPPVFEEVAEEGAEEDSEEEDEEITEEVTDDVSQSPQMDSRTSLSGSTQMDSERKSTASKKSWKLRQRPSSSYHRPNPAQERIPEENVPEIMQPVRPSLPQRPSTAGGRPSYSGLSGMMGSTTKDDMGYDNESQYGGSTRDGSRMEAWSQAGTEDTWSNSGYDGSEMKEQSLISECWTPSTTACSSPEPRPDSRLSVLHGKAARHEVEDGEVSEMNSPTRQSFNRPASAPAGRGSRRMSNSVRACPTEQMQEQKIFRRMLRQVGKVAEFQYRTVRKTFEIIDRDKDGKVTEDEMAMFFEHYGVDPKWGRRFFKVIDKDNKGKLDWHLFMVMFAPVISENKEMWDEENRARKSMRYPVWKMIPGPQFGRQTPMLA